MYRLIIRKHHPAEDRTGIGVCFARSGPAGRILRHLVLTAVMVMGIYSSVFGANYLPEYKLKAAVLLNIIKFVDWPETAWPDEGEPLTVGILGVDPFGPFMEEVLNDRKIKGRDVRIIRSNTLPGLMDCQVLFISDSKESVLMNILDELQGRPVLVVGDMARFVHLGGMISIVRAGDKIQFDVNRAAYKAAEFTINAQLLKLAREMVEE